MFAVFGILTTKSRFHTILSYLQLQYFFFNSFFWVSHMSKYRLWVAAQLTVPSFGFYRYFSPIVQFHFNTCLKLPKLIFSWFHKIKTGFLFRVRLFKNSRKTLPMWLYRKCVFIDVINGNIFNSLLGITIEIQMKEEYVVIVRYPNRYYAG